MKKKLLGTVLAAALVVLSSMSALAAGSRTADVTPVGDSDGNYVVSEYSEEQLAELTAEAPEVADLIQEINNDEKDLMAVAEEQAPELREELEGKTMLTLFVDLSTIGEVELNANGMYEVTLSVPTLTEAATNVRILHYSTERSLWEIIEPTNVDYTNKEITAEFEDLSPIAVIADVDTSADNAVGTSPKTGVASRWGWYLGGSAVLFAAAAILGRRKRA